METSLRYDANRRTLSLFAKERFTNAQDVVLTVSGELDTRDGRLRGKAHVRKRLYASAKSSPLVPDRADVGLTYDSTRDDVTYGARVRKTVDVSASRDGMTTIEAKAGVSYGAKDHRAATEGSIELQHKVFNFQEDQDVRVRVGYNFATSEPYAQFRENNWTLNIHRNTWSVCFDM